MRFGIVSNLVGQRAGTPHVRLPQGLVNEESEWLYYWRDACRSMPGRAAALSSARTPDTYPILRYHYHQASDGTDYLFAFTKAHGYVWGGSSWTLMFTCGSDCTAWSTENFGQYVVATNNLDLVQYWDDANPAGSFAPLGGVSGILYDATHYITRAKVVFRHWNYLHLMDVTKDGTRYRNIDQWCDAGDMSSWREDHPSGGDANFRELGPNDNIVGAGIYDVQGANQLIVFTQHTANAAWLVTDDLVYESHDILSATGCAGADTIVNAPDGQLYYISTDDDGIREVRRVYDPNPLSYDIQSTLDLMHPTLCSNAAATYMGQFRQIWWSVPGNGASTGNDLVLVYSLETQTWQPDLPMDIAAFGYYTLQAATHIDDMADVVDTVLGRVDSYAPAPGAPLSIVSDYNGYTWSTGTGDTDKAIARTSQLVLSTDLSPDGGLLNTFKRIHGAWFYFLTHSGTADSVAISVKKGDGAAYTNKGTVTLDGDGQTVRQWLRFDCKTRNLDLKLASTNSFEFIGVVFDFDLCGERA